MNIYSNYSTYSNFTWIQRTQIEKICWDFHSPKSGIKNKSPGSVQVGGVKQFLSVPPILPSHFYLSCPGINPVQIFARPIKSQRFNTPKSNRYQGHGCCWWCWIFPKTYFLHKLDIWNLLLVHRILVWFC